MAESADAADLKSAGVILVGSSPTPGTTYKKLSNPGKVSNDPEEVLSNFLKSRRGGLSPQTIDFYQGYLNRAKDVIGINITGQQIALFLDALRCSNGGKHAYFSALRAFYNWLYSRRSGYGLSPLRALYTAHLMV